MYCAVDGSVLHRCCSGGGVLLLLLAYRDTAGREAGGGGPSTSTHMWWQPTSCAWYQGSPSHRAATRLLAVVGAFGNLKHTGRTVPCNKVKHFMITIIFNLVKLLNKQQDHNKSDPFRMTVGFLLNNLNLTTLYLQIFSTSFSLKM